jgi:hypothetical protein
MFAVIVTGKEVWPAGPHLPTTRPMTKKGEKFWVCDIEPAWVPATGTSLSFSKDPPRDIKTFPTAEAADEFGKKWIGHPWWVQPKSHEVIELEPVYKVDYYKVKR